MKYRVMLNIIAIALLMMVAFPAIAQDGFSEEEQALVDTVTTALDQFAALDSFSFSTTQIMEQEVISPPGSNTRLVTEMEQDIVGELVMNTDDGSGATRQTVAQELSMEMTGQGSASQSLTMEFVAVNNTIYVNITEAAGAGVDSLPRGWINLNEDPDAFPGAETFNVEALTEQATNVVPLIELNETTVASITALEPETLNEREMQVISIEWDTAGYIDEMEGALDELLNLEALGLNSEAFIEEMLNGLKISQTMWIDAEDGTIYQIEQVQIVDIELTAEATGSFPVELHQTITTVVTFADFNESFTIEAPALE